MSDVRKSLRDRAKEFAFSLHFMEGRERGSIDEIKGAVHTIVDYGFLTNDAGQPYVGFIVKEDSANFYFGGMVLTDQLMKLDAEGYYDDIVKEGLPVLMTDVKSRKTNKTYTNVEFYPEI